MPAGLVAERLLLHPARARAHGRGAARPDRRRAAAARRHAALAWVTLAASSARRWSSLVPFARHARRGRARPDRGRPASALFFKVIFLVAAALTVLMSTRYLEVEGAQPGRVLLPDPLRHARHDDHGGRHRSHHHLHRPRDDGGVVLHPGRLHQAEPAVERSGGQVLPARRVLARHPALRHVAAVRPVGHDEPAGDGAGCSSARSATRGWCWPSSSSWPASASRSRRCRSTCGRRTCTKARRRRSRRSCRSARRRRRSRCCCGSSSRGCPSMSADWRLLFEVLAIVTMTVGNLAALTQTQHQAHARVLVDRARRLPADRRRRGHAARRHGDARLSVRSTRSCSSAPSP